MISRLKNREDMIRIYENVLAKTLTVLQTEDEVRQCLYSISPGGVGLDTSEKKKMEKTLSLGNKNTKAHIIQTRIRGKVSIEMKGSLEETTEFLKDFVSRIDSSSELSRSTLEKKEEED